MANASGASEFVDATTADQYIDEIWSKYIIRAREQRLCFARIATRKYQEGLSHGETIHVPQVAHLTPQTKNLAANTAVLFETDTGTHVDITIGTWSYVAMAVETATAKQSYKDLIELYGPEMGYALALAVDDDLAALVDDFGTNIVGSLGSLPTYEQFLEARRKLNDANVPRKGRAGIFSPMAEEGFLQLDQFIRNDYSRIQGKTDDDDDMGYVGSWFGIPIYVSTNVEGDNTAGHDNTIMHSEAIACCMQMKPTTHRWLDINYLANKVVTEQLYGVKEMRDDHGTWFKAA
jgi:N4-gp56 family major capsid protein